MAERIADNALLIVDEMKRKARRRLVGAIVLALAAAIIVPTLLEKEPRPLGDDVSVQIPPVDEGRFVNRLTGKADDAKPLPKADGKANAGTAANKPEPKSEAQAGAAPPPGAAQSASTAPTVAAASEAKPAAGAASPVPPAATAAAPAKAEGFVVQLAAFADDKGANALANKLKKSGYAAYVQPVETSRGTLWRVRVGGYGSRPDADAARVTLKGEGYSGIVAPAQ